MLSSLLKSNLAASVNVSIIKEFIKMKQYISKNLISNNLVEQKLLEHDKRIHILENTLNNFKEQTNHIFF